MNLTSSSRAARSGARAARASCREVHGGRHVRDRRRRQLIELNPAKYGGKIQVTPAVWWPSRTRSPTASRRSAASAPRPWSPACSGSGPNLATLEGDGTVILAVDDLRRYGQRPVRPSRPGRQPGHHRRYLRYVQGLSDPLAPNQIDQHHGFLDDVKKGANSLGVDQLVGEGHPDEAPGVLLLHDWASCRSRGPVSPAPTTPPSSPGIEGELAELVAAGTVVDLTLKTAYRLRPRRPLPPPRGRPPPAGEAAAPAAGRTCATGPPAPPAPPPRRRPGRSPGSAGRGAAGSGGTGRRPASGGPSPSTTSERRLKPNW